MRDTLGARPDAQGEMTLAFGAVPRGDKEIAVLSRSMMEILLEIALGIDVPADHVDAGRTAASARAVEAAIRATGRWSASSRAERPADAFAAVRHRDTWYWIDDRDSGRSACCRS